MAKTVLILGARGRLGQALLRAFVGAGWRVLAQVRPQGQQPSLAGVQWLPMGLDDLSALARAAQGAALVVHALNPPYVRWRSEVVPLMQSAIDLARRLHARLMFPGNVYNYGVSMPGQIDEDTEMQPSTRKGRIRVQAEQLLAHNTDVPSVILRAGDFFGSGTGSWFDLALVKHIEQGKITLLGDPEVATPWAYVPDLARAFVALATRWEEDPGCMPHHSSWCYAGHQISGSEWIAELTAVARERGWIDAKQRLRVSTLPWGLFRLVSFAVPLFRELAEMQYLSSTAHALSGQRLQALIGPVHSTPLPVAVRAALADLGKV